MLAPAAAELPRDLPVICYHQIAPKAPNEMVTTPQRFREQLDYLRQHGYQTITLEQAERFYRGKWTKKMPARPVLLTFDDGYSGVHTYGLPELKKRKMKAVVFLVVGQVGRMKPTPHLTRAQVLEMSRSKVFEFGSHTYDMHVPIPERWQAGRLSRFALRKDLVRSREVLQGWLKKPVRSLAWPYGHYDERSLQVAREAGFKQIYTTDYGYNVPGCGPLRVRRIRLSSEYDTVEVLRLKLASGG